jgi:hypothetical protein
VFYVAYFVLFSFFYQSRNRILVTSWRPLHSFNGHLGFNRLGCVHDDDNNNHAVLMLPRIKLFYSSMTKVGKSLTLWAINSLLQVTSKGGGPKWPSARRYDWLRKKKKIRKKKVNTTDLRPGSRWQVTWQKSHGAVPRYGNPLLRFTGSIRKAISAQVARV